MNDERVARLGCGCMFYISGMVLAVVWSWGINRSIVWAVLHGWLSWIYIVYRLWFA